MARPCFASPRAMLTIALLTAAGQPAFAGVAVGGDLIGGELTVFRGTDTGGGLDLFNPTSVGPIEVGPGDLTNIGGAPSIGFPITIDPETSSFTIAVASTGFAGSPFTFNGFVVQDFGWQDAPRRITGVAVTTNATISGFSPSNVTFEPDAVLVDFAGLSVNNRSVTVDLITEMLPFGDMNRDGVVDGLDIDPFVQTLTGGTPFDIAADLNGDGVVDGLDIDPFVQTLTGGSGGDASNPDPGGGPHLSPTPTAATAGLMLAALAGLRRRRR